MDFGQLAVNAIVVFTTLAVVLTCVGVHYEGLNFLARRLSHREGPRRPRVLYAVLGALALHVAQIWIFGLGLWSLLKLPDAGTLTGNGGNLLLEAVYLSAVSFSTVGFGDVVPTGAVRFLIGTESLVGLVLITWSASFTFLEMERNWRER